MIRGWLVAVVLLAAGCAGSPAGVATDPDREPAAALLALEESVPTALMIAGALTEAGDPAGALPYYRFAFERQPDDETIGRRYAMAAIHAGRGREAEQALAAMQERFPKQWEIALQRARLLVLLEEEELAAQLAGKLYAAHPEEPEVIDLQVDLLARRGDTAAALEVLAKAPESARDDADQRLRRATLLLAGGDAAAAEVEVRRTLDTDPGHDPSLEFFALLLRNQGRVEDLGRALEGWIGTRTDLRLASLELADVRIAQGDAPGAADLLVPLAERGELEWNDKLLLADLLGKIGRTEEARTFVDELLTDGWDGPLVLRLAGTLATDAEDFAAAETYLRQSLRQAPGDVDTMISLLMVLSQRHPGLASMSREEEPRRQFEALLDRAHELADPDQIRHQYIVGALLRRSDRNADAVPLLRRAAELEPDNEQILYDLATSQEQVGDFEGAVATLEALLPLRPDDAHTLNFFGYLLADQGWQLERAESMIVRALEQEPDNPFYLDSLGWVHFRLGRYEEALESLVSATNELGDDPVILEHVGDALAALSRYQDALRVYRTAQERGGAPERLDPRVREMERLLRETP